MKKARRAGTRARTETRTFTKKGQRAGPRQGHVPWNKNKGMDRNMDSARARGKDNDKCWDIPQPPSLCFVFPSICILILKYIYIYIHIYIYIYISVYV